MSRDGRSGWGSDVDALVEAARQSIGGSAGDDPTPEVLALADVAGELTPTDAVDLLERASAFGLLGTVVALHEMVGDFAYRSWALALALRSAREPVARWLLADGVDLLAPPRQPRRSRGLIPPEGTFTRFGLTRDSPTLFLNPLDPTVTSEVFEPYGCGDQLRGRPYATDFDLEKTCELVGRLAGEACFDATVADDLLRAALVRAARLLRAQDGEPGMPKDATACLELAALLYELHRAGRIGDASMDLILGNLIVPKQDRRIVAFVCRRAPAVFLGRVGALAWLKDDIDLVCAMVPELRGSTAGQNAELAVVLARHGRLGELRCVSRWPGGLSHEALEACLDAASKAGHAETAAWVLTEMQRHRTSPGGEGSFLDDLLL